ncbi:MHYT domain-containing protein [Streptomyces physcomitrii]|uniref:MHYT domain-containing protein n=1 Tax=Streptomyces physcomitrii TaxID=2724184 RepID=A0ABX1GZW6_9ACTN|nr:MHYT domain-containing protein [Streptomyces physcomitrii]NKI41283.1 hypothetical protein [Streptomyces physcomitrii]
MHGTVDGFSYGLVTPLVAFLMGCLGGALGLRCTVRSLAEPPRRRAGWLALGSLAIGSGIWSMHFIAMMGFDVRESTLAYDRLTMVASLAVAVVMTGVGIFIVGYRGPRGTALFTGGTVTGLGIASMHYLGMAGIRLNGRIDYNTLLVTASVLIAVGAATAALWAAGQVRGFAWSVGASLAMGLATAGMHYTGMAAVDVRLHDHGAAADPAGDSPASLLAPMLIGPLGFLLLAGAIVLFDPMRVMGRPRVGRPGRGPETLPSAVNPGGRIPHQRPRVRTPQR